MWPTLPSTKKRNGVWKEKTKLKISVQSQKSVYGKVFRILEKEIFCERNLSFPNLTAVLKDI